MSKVLLCFLPLFVFWRFLPLLVKHHGGAGLDKTWVGFLFLLFFGQTVAISVCVLKSC